MRVAFATCSWFADGFADDHEAGALLGADYRVWNDPAVDWGAYDRVVIRSVWDYTSDLGAFIAWCRQIGADRLRNDLALVEFNADKRYLSELSAPTVPTTFVSGGDPLPTLGGEVVVKPNVSAGARDTGRFPADHHAAALALIDHIRAGGRTALVQPYLPGVDERGETAVVFIGGERSHVLRKRPVLRSPGVAPLGDAAGAPAAVMFEDDLVLAADATAAELELAAAVHGQIADRFGAPLYARIDMVPDADGAPVVIELEALDPCLYMGQAPGAAGRLADAVRAS